MPKSTSVHSAVIQVSLAPALVKQLNTLAASAGMTRSEYIRSLIHAEFKQKLISERSPRP